MGGQEKWNKAGSDDNAYIVLPKIERQIDFESEYRTFWGRANYGRKVREKVIGNDTKKIRVDVGNDSPVWEKDFTDEGNECRFTLAEQIAGVESWGDSEVETGDYPSFMHSVCYVRRCKSEGIPVPGEESQHLAKSVIVSYAMHNKDLLMTFKAKVVDMDGFRGFFQGASAGLLSSTRGGMGVSLPGGSAGQQRSPYNNIIGGTYDVVNPSATLSTHESNLATKLSSITDDDKYHFSRETHELIDYYVDELITSGPVKVGGREYRAIAGTTRANISRLRKDPDFREDLRYAWERGKDNPLFQFYRFTIELDDILYVPLKQLEYIKPKIVDGSIVYGARAGVNFTSKNFSNSDAYLQPTMILGRGALLRGKRKGVKVTVETGKHEVGSEYAVHWFDGWMRNDRFADDGRTEMLNNSSFCVWNYDKGFGTTAAA